MKQNILLISILIILVNASFVLGAFSIPETLIELSSSAPGSAAGTITLSSTESSMINVSFSNTAMTCLSNPSETLAITIPSPFPVPANSNITASFNIAVPSNKFACRYFGQLIATPSSGNPDGVNIYLNVTPNSNIDIQNKTETLVRNLSETKTLNIALVNTGNTDLFAQYTYSNFSKGSTILVNGGSGAKIISHGTTQYIQVFLSIPSGATDGTYTSTLTLSGDINRTATLTVTLKSPILDVSVPQFEMPESERNDSLTETFTIKNVGDFDLNNIDITDNAASKYDVTITPSTNFLAPGQEMDVTVTAFIPEDEQTLKHNIGKVYFSSDRINKTVDLSLDVSSKLQIEYVEVTINENTEKINGNGEVVDDTENYPGSDFDVKVKVCNMYSESKNGISDIDIEAVLSEIDDGDDMEGSADTFDLSGDKCLEKTISFDSDKIPVLTEEGTYDLTINIQGDDDDFGGNQEANWTIPVKIYRDDKPNIQFDEVSISPTAVTCDRNLVLKASAYNVGDKDKNAYLKITNSALGISIQKAFRIGDTISDDCDAIDEPDEECIGFDKSFGITLPDVLSTGSYPISFEVFVENDKKTDNETVVLTVTQCGGTATGGNTGSSSGSSTGSGSSGSYTEGTTNVSVGGGSAGIVISGTSSDVSSSGTTSGTPVRVRQLTDNSALQTAGIIAGIIIAVLVIIGVIAALLRKPETL